MTLHERLMDDHLNKVALVGAVAIICFFIFISICLADIFGGLACVENKQGKRGVVVSRRIHDYTTGEYWYIVFYPFGEEHSALEKDLKECPCSKVDLNNLSIQQKDFIQEQIDRTWERTKNE